MLHIKKAIINGISGQDGAYLSAYLLEKGYSILGVYRGDNDRDLFRLDYLGIKDKVNLVNTDLTDLSACNELMTMYNPDEIYNLGAQSSVAYSFGHPIETISYNISSVVNLLEAIRMTNANIRFYQASSSEMFGKASTLPISKETTLHPLSPYAISKATGHWLVSQYRESYGLYAASGILFNHESFLRLDSFFVKKVIKAAIRISRGQQDVLTVGNIDIKRDFGFAKEYVKAIWLILQQSKPEDFQVCSGISVSLRDIIYYVFDHFGLERNLIRQDPALFRPSDLEDMYGDNTEIKKKTGWTYDLTFFDVLDILIEEELKNELGAK